MSSNSNSILLSLLAGIAIGILIAPDKGSKTRKKLKDSFDNEKDSLLDKWHELTNDVKNSLSEKKSVSNESNDDEINSSIITKQEEINKLENQLAELKANLK